MRWSFRLLTVAGIRIEVHATFLLMVAAVALLQSRSTPVWLSVGELALLFGCVLLHELGHALAARHYGIATRSILLLPFGGLARLERMPEKPSQEIIVALAGPAVNVVIARLISQQGAQGSVSEEAKMMNDRINRLFDRYQPKKNPNASTMTGKAWTGPCTHDGKPWGRNRARAARNMSPPGTRKSNADFLSDAITNRYLPRR